MYNIQAEMSSKLWDFPAFFPDFDQDWHFWPGIPHAGNYLGEIVPIGR
jgi:hypothetical protein